MKGQKYKRSIWAGGLLLRDGCILMVLNCWDDAEVWGLPGGYSPPGEPLAETVRRELHEEAGLDVDVGALAYVAESFRPPGEGGIRTHALAFVFCLQSSNKALGPQDPDGWVQEIRWVPVAELESYLEPVRRRGWRVFWEPLLDWVAKTNAGQPGGRFYNYAETP